MLFQELDNFAKRLTHLKVEKVQWNEMDFIWNRVKSITFRIVQTFRFLLLLKEAI